MLISCTSVNTYPDHCQTGQEQVCPEELTTLRGSDAKHDKQSVRVLSWSFVYPWNCEHRKGSADVLGDVSTMYAVQTLVYVFLYSSVHLINIYENYICTSRGENTPLCWFLQEIYYSQHSICLFQISDTSCFRDIQNPQIITAKLVYGSRLENKYV